MGKENPILYSEIVTTFSNLLRSKKKQKIAFQEFKIQEFKINKESSPNMIERYSIF